jgi:hypothetical protein
MNELCQGRPISGDLYPVEIYVAVSATTYYIVLLKIAPHV